MMDYFAPSIARARQCRSAMDQALWSSVRMVLSERGSSGKAALDGTCPAPGDTGPLDYGAYFDLVLPPPDGSPLPPDVKEHAAVYLEGRLAADPGASATAGEPTVGNLSSDCFSPIEIDRLRRWWDIEPDNAMCLAGITDGEFAVARQALARAMEQLRQTAPEMHGELLAAISDIVIARPDGSQRLTFGGASSFALWGAFTINASSHEHWLHYYQTLVHETGHNLLFAMARSEPLVTDAPDERHSSPLRDDLRPMDGIFHAAFVSAREALAFDMLMTSHEESGCLEHEDAEMLSRLLEGSVLAFWDCASTLRNEATLTGLGEAILGECESFMQANFRVEPA